MHSRGDPPGRSAARPAAARSRGAAGEDRDRLAVDRAGRERAANGELHAGGPVLAREHENVDHLPGRFRGAVALGQRGPELIEAAGPCAAFAFLGERE